jgi:hypothetical protein
MNLLRSLLLILYVILTGDTAFSQTEVPTALQQSLNNFTVKENLLKNNKLAIIASDEDDNPIESLNGTFRFSINGFQQDMKFNDGVAIAPQVIDKSTFVYVRHENESGTHGKLFYIYKKGGDLNPFEISWIYLIIIPLSIIILAYLFRKFIIIGGILLILLFIYNSRNGLKLSTLIDTIMDGLKGLVG